jgi:hypothetical protein
LYLCINVLYLMRLLRTSLVVRLPGLILCNTESCTYTTYIQYIVSHIFHSIYDIYPVYPSAVSVTYTVYGLSSRFIYHKYNLCLVSFLVSNIYFLSSSTWPIFAIYLLYLPSLYWQ